MRNLKRALSMAMASVMLMGMSVVGTSAASVSDFSDVDSINNLEAVSIATGLGIFDGYDDGEFKPEKVVNRAEMAVVITKILKGADVDPENFVGESKFTDVPAWAEGYVNAVAGMGIIEGVGDNKFDPYAPVTTAQANTMLLKALGYFTSEGDALGKDWDLEATTKAVELGFYGEKNLKMNQGLTREDVAELTFNALFAQRVVYEESGKRYVKYTDDDVTVTNGTKDEMNTLAQNTFGLYAVEGQIVGNSITHANLAGLADEIGDTRVKFEETVDLDKDGKKDYASYDFEYETGLDMIGHKVEVYYTVEKGNPVVFTMVDEATNVAVLTYVHDDTTKLAKAANDAGFKKNTILNISSDDYNVNYDMNTTVFAKGGIYGSVGTLAADTAIRSRAIKDKDIIVISNSANYQVDEVIVLDQKLDQVSNVKTKDDVTTYTLKQSATSNTVAAYDAAKDDYVIVTNIGMNGTRYAFEAADLQAANISKITGKTGQVTAVTADDVDYVKSPVLDMGVATTVFNNITNLGDTTLILDKAGKLIGLKGKTVAPQYAYVAQYGVRHVDSGVSTKDVLVAHLYFADGTDKVVEVSNLSTAAMFGGTVLTNPANFADPTIPANNKLNADTYTTADGAPAMALGTNGLGIWQFSYDTKDRVILTAVTTDESEKTLANDQFIKGHSTIVRGSGAGRTNVEGDNAITDNDDLYMHSETVYFFVNGDYTDADFSVVPFVGVANMPSFKVEAAYTDPVDNTDVNVAQMFVKHSTVKKGRNTVTAVLVEDEPMDTGVGLYYYNEGSYKYVENAEKTIDLTYYIYDMDGEPYEVTYTVKDEATAKSWANAKETGFYQIGTKDMLDWNVLDTVSGSAWTHVVAPGVDHSYRVDNKMEYVVNAGVSTNATTYDYDKYEWNFFDNVTTVGAIFDEDTILVDTCDSGLTTVDDIIAELVEGGKITISYSYNNETYESGIVFITSYVAPATGAPGSNNTTTYKIDNEAYTAGATTAIKFQIFDKNGNEIKDATSVTYKVEMLNGGVWVPTMENTATIAHDTTDYDFTVNVDTLSNNVAVRITFTAISATAGAVTGVISDT